MNLKTGFSHLDMEPLPLKTKGNPCRPKGFIPDLMDVPRLTSENDPQSGATRFRAFGPSCKMQVMASLGGWMWQTGGNSGGGHAT